MIDLIQNNEQWSTTRGKLNEVIATINVLAGEYTAKPVFSSIVASLDEKTKDITAEIGFVNKGGWPIKQLAVEISTDNFVSGKSTSIYAEDDDIVSGSPLSGSVSITGSLKTLGIDDADGIYCRAVWAGMVTSVVVVAAS